MRISPLLIATALGRVVTVATQLVVAQFLSPSDMGNFVVAAAVVNATALFQSGDLPRVALQDRDGPLVALAAMRTWFLLGTALIVAALPFATRWMPAAVDPQVLRALTVIPLLRVMINARSTMLARAGLSSRLAAVSLTESLARGLVLAVLAITVSGPWALVVAEIVAVSAAAVVATSLAPPLVATVFRLPRTLVGKLLSALGVSQLVAIERELGPLIIGTSLGVAAAGSYAFAQRVSNQMVVIFLPLVALEIVPRLIRAVHDRDDVAAVYRTELGRLLKGLVPAALALGTLVPIALVLIWPGKWNDAAWLLPCLTLATGTRVVYSTLKGELEAHGLLSRVLALTLCDTAMIAVALFIGSRLASASGIASALAAEAAIIVALSWQFVRRARRAAPR